MGRISEGQDGIATFTRYTHVRRALVKMKTEEQVSIQLLGGRQLPPRRPRTDVFQRDGAILVSIALRVQGTRRCRMRYQEPAAGHRDRGAGRCICDFICPIDD